MKKTMTFLLTCLGLLAGLGLGVLLVAMIGRIPGLSDGQELALYVLAFLMLYVFFLVETVLHEAGHLIFGLMTGWRFVSFRIASMMWLRGGDGRIRRARFSLAGTAGQCLLAPPPWREENFPYQLYNMGGVIVNLLTAAVCGLLAWALWLRPVAALLLVEAALVGLIMALTNGIPMPGLTVNNDASNQRNMMRSRDARRALWVQMNVAAAQTEGKSLREMPEEWFEPFPEASMDNPLVASVAVFSAQRLLDALDLPGAEAAIRALLAREKGVLALYQALLTLDGAYCELVGGHPADMTEGLDKPAVRQIMKAMRRYPSVLRTQYAEALIRRHDEAQAGKYLEAFEKAAADYPYPQEIENERKLIAIAKEAAA